MAKKPAAARGKTTRVGKIKKIARSLIKGVKPKVSNKTKAKRLRTIIEQRLGPGLAGAGMTSQAMKLAKKLKPSGRLSASDMKRAKQMLAKRKGK